MSSDWLQFNRSVVTLLIVLFTLMLRVIVLFRHSFTQRVVAQRVVYPQCRTHATLRTGYARTCLPAQWSKQVDTSMHRVCCVCVQSQTQLRLWCVTCVLRSGMCVSVYLYRWRYTHWDNFMTVTHHTPQTAPLELSDVLGYFCNCSCAARQNARLQTQHTGKEGKTENSKLTFTLFQVQTPACTTTTIVIKPLRFAVHCIPTVVRLRLHRLLCLGNIVTNTHFTRTTYAADACTSMQRNWLRRAATMPLCNEIGTPWASNSMIYRVFVWHIALGKRASKYAMHIQVEEEEKKHKHTCWIEWHSISIPPGVLMLYRKCSAIMQVEQKWRKRVLLGESGVGNSRLGLHNVV